MQFNKFRWPEVVFSYFIMMLCEQSVVLCHPSKLVLFKASSYNLPDMFQLKDPINYQNKYREGEDFDG